MTGRFFTGTRDRRALPALFAALAAVVVAPGTEAAEFSNGNTITIPDSGVASTYPSTIEVSGLDGVISRVKVRLNAVVHSNDEDLDILLRSPDGTSMVLMSDATCDALVNPFFVASISFEDESLSLVSTADFEFDTFRPTDNNTGAADAWPGPAPAGPHEQHLSSFAGENPNGLWRLFVVDDSAGSAGEIIGGWSIEVETAQRFDSPDAISTPGGIAPANIYPSVLSVSGLPDEAVEVRVRLHGVTTSPDTGNGFVGGLLRAPNGRTSLLFFSATGTAADAEIVLSDRGAVPILDLGLQGALGFISGTYQAAQLHAATAAFAVFPEPSPDAPYDQTLSRFSGIDPNGEWKLFVAGITATAQPMQISGWSLDFVYPGSAPAAPTCDGDADADGDVDFDDLNMVLFKFNSICP